MVVCVTAQQLLLAGLKDFVDLFQGIEGEMYNCEFELVSFLFFFQNIFWVFFVPLLIEQLKDVTGSGRWAVGGW